MQDDLRKEYIHSLSERLKQIRALLKEYGEGNVMAEQNIRLVAHSLYGSGATFGFPQISAVSRKVENSSKADIIKDLSELIKVLKKVIENPEREAQEASQDVLPDNVNEMDQDVTTILLIDDDASSLALISETIAKAYPDMLIDIAKSGNEAEEKLGRNTYSLVVLDLILPDWDGREILRKIRQEFQLGIPVIIISGITRDVVRVECMSLGADKVLEKPFSEDAVVNAIAQVLKKKEKSKLSLVPMGEEHNKKSENGRGKEKYSAKEILVVEDDKMQAAIITQKLMEQGFSVKRVENGREAIAELRIKPFSLIILDVKMPHMDGFEVLDRIRGELNMKKVPIIMLTAVGNEADIIKGYDMGADDYILKPFSKVQLIARVKSLLKKEV